LGSSNPTTSVWFLKNTGTNNVTNVDVSYSSASLGVTINAYDGSSVDSGNNTNWNFTAPADTGIRYWIASSPGNWSNASNWSLVSGGSISGGLPLSSHTVVFDGGGLGASSVDGGFAGDISINGRS